MFAAADAYQSVQIVDGVSTLCMNILGYNFGGEFVAGNSSLLSVTVAGVHCASILSSNHTNIVCCTAITTGLTIVTVAGEASQGVVVRSNVRAASGRCRLVWFLGVVATA